MAAKLTLGRDLNALLGKEPVTERQRPQQTSPNEGIKTLGCAQLTRGQYQPRWILKEEELDALARSIEQQGILQPIVVRPLAKSDQFEILAGERRWRAAQKAGLDVVPVIIKEVSDQEALAVALIENIQREDLNPLEEAKALSRLAEEFSLTHQAVAELVGKNRSTVSNLLRLLTVEPWLQQKMIDGVLEMGHVRALLTHTPDEQRQMVDRIERFSLTVRETERWLQKKQKDEKSGKPHLHLSSDIIRLQRQLSDKLGSPVKIQKTKAGKGQLTIAFRGEDELISLLSWMSAEEEQSA